MKPPNYDALIATLDAAFAANVQFTREQAATTMGVRVGEADRILRYARKKGVNNIARHATTGLWLFTA